MMRQERRTPPSLAINTGPKNGRQAMVQELMPNTSPNSVAMGMVNRV
jgi:hypothetical protein